MKRGLECGRRSYSKEDSDTISTHTDSTTDTMPAFSEGVKVEKLPKIRRWNKLNKEEDRTYAKWIETLLQQKKIRQIEEKEARLILPPRIVGERVTHDCRPLLPFINKDGKFPNIQATWPIIYWATQQEFLAKIDLSKAFHTIPLSKDQMTTYTFRRKDKFYAYNNMPMGAVNAPKHFHMVIGRILNKLPFAKDVRWYQDDIFISATSRTEIRKRFIQTRQWLEKNKFKINDEKSELKCKNILGYQIEGRCLKIEGGKEARLRGMMETDLVRACQTLLYYRHIISPATYNTARKIVSGKIKNKQIIDIYRKAILQDKWRRYYERARKERIEIYYDASNKGYAAIVRHGKNKIITAAYKQEVGHNYANFNEAIGLFKIIKRHWMQIKDYMKALECKDLYIYSDNRTLIHALNKGGGKRSEMDGIAERIKSLTSEMNTRFIHIHGAVNPADKPSRENTLRRFVWWRGRRKKLRVRQAGARTPPTKHTENTPPPGRRQKRLLDPEGESRKMGRKGDAVSDIR